MSEEKEESREEALERVFQELRDEDEPTTSDWAVAKKFAEDISVRRILGRAIRANEWELGMSMLNASDLSDVSSLAKVQGMMLGVNRVVMTLVAIQLEEEEE